MCYGHICGACGVSAQYSRHTVNSICNNLSSVGATSFCFSRSLANCPYCDPVTWHGSPLLNSFMVRRLGENWLAVSLMPNTPTSARFRTNLEASVMASPPAEPECGCQGCTYR